MLPRAPGEVPASRPGRVPPDLCLGCADVLEHLIGGPRWPRRVLMSTAKGRLLVAVVGVLLGVLVWQQPAAATQLYVDNVRTCAGQTPCYPTIMAAVNVAVAGDTV